MNFTPIDVSDLAPPEPMTMILSAISQLEKTPKATEQCLVVKHRRQPFPLYEKLISAGWAYHCQVNAEDDILLYIYRQTSQQAFEQSFKKHSKQNIVNSMNIENGRHS